MSVSRVTCKAPVNIATVKYWGKSDDDLIIPMNDSISVTLSSEEIFAKTTVATSSKFSKDRVWINGEEQDIAENKRLGTCLQIVKRLSRKRKSNDGVSRYCIHVASENNFPTAAGLASSAAGYACLVYSLAKLLNIDGDISTIVRQGSGSACRSIHGGFVIWRKGEKTDGSDSISKQLKRFDFWPEMRVLIVVVNANRKKVSSTVGMKRSVETSLLYAHRVSNIVSRHISKMMEAIEARDFHSFADVTMKESNQLHAVCLDSFPPISYLTDSSHEIISLVTQYNDFYGGNKVAYTFDAGPNACLFMMDSHVEEFMALINRYFPRKYKERNHVRGSHIAESDLSSDLISRVNLERREDSVKYVIHTKVGDGPQVVDDDDDQSLLDANGMLIETT